MARKISISFKETEKDIELYDLLYGMEDRSCEMKKILRKAFKLDTQEVLKKDNTANLNKVNILDF